MKRFFVMLAFAWVCVGACMCLTACGGDDEQEDSVVKEMREYLTGKRWVKSGSDYEYWFLNNHMMVLQKKPNGIRSTAHYEYPYTELYSWDTANGKLFAYLVNTENAEQAQGFPCTPKDVSVYNKGILFENADGKEVKFTITQRITHYGDFVDYTDNTSHDKALHGRWEAENLVFLSLGKYEDYTVEIMSNGNAVFTSKETGKTLSTRYSTRNGCVTFEQYPGVKITDRSFHYLRGKDEMAMVIAKQHMLWKKI